MSVSLQKGQKIDLTKGNASLKRVMVGLGWDEAQQGGGFFGSRAADIDCDASAFLISAQTEKLNGAIDVVWFNNLVHFSRSVTHQGDNLTGAGDGDDEQILVDLDRVPSNYSKIVFVVNIYQAQQRNQHFGMIRNAFIRLVNADNNQELMIYNLSENYNGYTAMIFGEVYRYNNEWKFSAIGQATNDKDLVQLALRYGLPQSDVVSGPPPK
jgi:stress response protein SCP2